MNNLPKGYKIGDPLFKINDDDFVEEYYFVGNTKIKSYVIYADTVNQFPVRVYIEGITNRFFFTHKEALNKAIARTKNKLDILERKYEKT